MMNILFLTIHKIEDISIKGIYTDLLRMFSKEGHHIYIVSPRERRDKQKTYLKDSENIHYLGVKTLNIKKTNIIEKGIGTVLLEYQFLNAIKKHLNNTKFDLILYSTPPVTLVKVINFIKQRDSCFSYLMLKDIFPQNAVDLGMIKPSSLFYKLFKKKESSLYNISDKIGCMSPANIEYLLKHNSFLSKEKVELCPNAIEVENLKIPIDKENLKKKYNIPKDVFAFIYGGNLGKPQGLMFLLDILSSNKNRKDRFFVIVGSGTEYSLLSDWFNKNQPNNAILINNLPREEYDNLLQVCNAGLIFLDPRFTIPNYPSRLLSYLEYKMPVITATDINTDIGQIAEKNGYGFSCLSGNLNKFNSIMDSFVENPDMADEMGMKGYNYLLNNYTVQQAYNNIINSYKNRRS